MMIEYIRLEASMLKIPFSRVSSACMIGMALIAAGSLNAQTPSEASVKGNPAEAAYRTAASKYQLEFDITELSADQLRVKADEVGREAASAYQSGQYQKAIDLYLQAIKIFDKLGEDPTVLKKKENCKLAISKAYYYWAEKLYFDAQASADAKRYDQAIKLCENAAEMWPAAKSRMQEAIARFKKLKASAEYEEKVSPDVVDAGRSARLYSIEVLLKQGDVFYADAQWDKARDKYEEVMSIDPFNVKAMDAIRRINLKLLEAGRHRTGATRAEYIAETEWKMLTPLVPRISSGPAKTQTTEEPIVKDEQKNSIYNKLKNIIIDRIDFDEIEVPVVLRHLRQRSKELDPDKVGVNIFLLPEDPTAAENAQQARRQNAPAVGPDGEPAAQSEEEEADFSSGRRISVTADSISLGQAISYICRTANLRVKVEKYAVVIAPPGVPLEQMETRIYPMEKEVVDRKISKATEGNADSSGGTMINPQDLFSNVPFDPGSQVVYDPSISRLIVTNTAENLQKIEETIKELNVIDPQVLIQTKFVEVHLNDLEELGFQYLFSRQNSNVQYAKESELIEYKPGDKLPDYAINIYQPQSSDSSGPSSKWYQYSGTFTNGQSSSADLPSSFYYKKAPVQDRSVSFGQNSQVVRSLKDSPGNADLQNQLFGFTHYNKYGYKVQTTINALDQADSADMLACPRITTMNGYDAVIAMVTEQYFPSDWNEAEIGTIAGTNGESVPLFTPSTPEFDDSERLGIELRVKPYVDATDNYTISLTMTPIIKTFVEWADYSYELTVESNGQSIPYENKLRMPVIEVRSIDTAVQCYDGETIILGGVIKDSTSSYDDQYPILGSLPLVGRLFQSKSKQAAKVNLLVFLTCRLINPDGSPVREREMRGLPPFRQ